MGKWCGAILALALAPALAAATPPDIVLPVPPSPPPMPMPPAPAIPTYTLSGNTIFDVVCNKPCVFLVSPPGVVKTPHRDIKAGAEFEKEGTYFDGSTTKTYAGPCTVYFLHPAAGTSGKVYVSVIPVGFSDASQIKSFVLDVNPGPAPPVPPPDPKPPTPPQPVTSFHVLFIYESKDTLTPQQLGVMYGIKVEDWLSVNARGNWRRRDKDAPGEKDATMAALWDAVKPKVTTTPCVAVEVNGKVDIIALDATPDAMIATLNKYLGK